MVQVGVLKTLKMSPLVGTCCVVGENSPSFYVQEEPFSAFVRYTGVEKRNVRNLCGADDIGTVGSCRVVFCRTVGIEADFFLCLKNIMILKDRRGE